MERWKLMARGNPASQATWIALLAVVDTGDAIYQVLIQVQRTGGVVSGGAREAGMQLVCDVQGQRPAGEPGRRGGLDEALWRDRRGIGGARHIDN